MSEPNGVTLIKLTQLVEEVAKVQAELVELGVTEKDLKNQKNLLLGKIQSALNDANLKNFRTHRGMVSVRKNWDCKLPKDPAKREEFFGWLRDQGWFEEWITVNSQTLNSQYKRLYEEKAKEGELFEMPGVGAPSYRETCVLTKG